MLLTLQQHPITSMPQINVQVAIIFQKSYIEFIYKVHGDITPLEIPKPNNIKRTDNLWKHTCAEAFVTKDEAGNGYWEWNFSPSGQWQMYEFDDYRKHRTKPRITKIPEISQTRHFDTLFLRVCIPRLSKIISRLGLNMILEDKDQQLSYWALKHAAGPPDFHNADTWFVM